MTDRYGYLETVLVEDHVVFRLEDLCRACGAQPHEVEALIEEGILDPDGDGPESWAFHGHALSRARTALRLTRDLELGFAGAAVVMDLLEEIEALRSRLRRG